MRPNDHGAGGCVGLAGGGRGLPNQRLAAMEQELFRLLESPRHACGEHDTSDAWSHVLPVRARGASITGVGAGLAAWLVAWMGRPRVESGTALAWASTA